MKQIPTPEQIKQLQQNCYNIQEWLDHVHGFCQDTVNEAYFKLSQDGSGDPTQRWVSGIMDIAMAVVADLDFPGAAITGYAMQSLVGSFSSDTPESLNKAFGDVWGRFSATFQTMQDSFGEWATNPEANWDKTIEDPFDPMGDKKFTVSDLGRPDVFFPSRNPQVEDKRFYNPEKYDESSDKTVAAFKYNLVKNVIGKKWNILHSPKNDFWDGWSDDDARKFAKDQTNSNRDIIVLWWPDQDGSCAGCPNNGMSVTEPRLGVGDWYSSWDYYHGESASKDMCDWLMQDDGYGTILNPDAITTRHDVFYNWPMEGNLTDHPEGRTGVSKDLPPVTEESRERARDWHNLFSNVSRSELEAGLVQKTIDDPSFKANLVRNPKEAIENYLGLKIPEEVKLEVILEKPGDYKLVLPYVGRPKKSGH